jgi:hypothetical protein
MWKNTPYKGCVYFSVAVNLASIILIFALKAFLPPVVPLFYGLPSGSEQLVQTLGLILVPMVGLIITITNVVINGFVEDNFLKRILIISSTFISILLTITIIKIIFLVGFF